MFSLLSSEEVSIYFQSALLGIMEGTVIHSVGIVTETLLDVSNQVEIVFMAVRMTIG